MWRKDRALSPEEAEKALVRCSVAERPNPVIGWPVMVRAKRSLSYNAATTRKRRMACTLIGVRNQRAERTVVILGSTFLPEMDRV